MGAAMMMTAVPVHRYHSNIIRPLFSTLRIVPLVLCLHSKWSAPVSFCVEACFDQTEGDVPICGHVGCGTMSMSGMRRQSLGHRRPGYVSTMWDQSDREGDVPVCGHVGCGTLSMSGMRRPSLEHRHPRYVSQLCKVHQTEREMCQYVDIWGAARCQ